MPLFSHNADCWFSGEAAHIYCTYNSQKCIDHAHEKRFEDFNSHSCFSLKKKFNTLVMTFNILFYVLTSF